MDTEEKNSRLLPASLLAALIGLLLGPIPAVAGVLVANRIFYPLFAAAPLFMYLFNSLLRGGRDSRTLIVTIVFSILSAYLGAVMCQVAFFVAGDGVSIFRIPAITAMVFGVSGILPESASAYVFPLVFTALGVAVAAELNRGPAGPRNAECRMQNAELESGTEGDAECIIQDTELKSGAEGDAESIIQDTELESENPDEE